jgi:hypothetical protein
MFENKFNYIVKSSDHKKYIYRIKNLNIQNKWGGNLDIGPLTNMFGLDMLKHRTNYKVKGSNHKKGNHFT